MALFVRRSTDNLHYEKFADGTVKCIEDEIPFEIPESWGWGRLGELVYNHGQRRPSADFSYIDISSIDNQHQRLSCEENILSSEKAPSRARKIVAYGDILYSTVRPYLHNMCIIDRIFSKQPIASTGFAVLTCHDDFFNEFLFYYMMSPDFDTYVNHTDNAKGVAYPSISDTRLYHALIPIPPAREQRDIVSAVKRLIHYINKYNIARNQLNRLMSNFPNAMKHSILQWAVQGKLVQQDESDEPASVLLDRIRAKKKELIKEGKLKKDKHESIIFRRDNSYYERLDGVERCIDDEIPFEIPKSWVWVRLGSITAITGGKRIPVGSKLTSKNTGHIYIRISDMCEESISTRNLLYVPIDIYPNISKYIIRKEDVYITVAGTIGRIGKIPKQLDGANLTENADRLRLFFIEQNWLIKVLQSPFIQKTIIEATTKVGQPKLAIAKIERFLIPLAPISEQKRMFEKIKQIENFVQNL